MALRLSGFTRASSLGPIATFMDRHGGSIARVLQNVDLPYAILENPEIVMPLREQFRLLERAARDTGDPNFGARLGQAVQAKALSAFGAWVCAAETLKGAIERAHLGLQDMLQTSTILTLTRHDRTIRWSIEFVEPETDGRHHNEFLGIGYMIDTVRCYAGPRWRPDVVMTALPRGASSAALEDIFGANVAHGFSVPAIEFPVSLLDRRRFQDTSIVRQSCPSPAEPVLPRRDDMLATVAAVTELALHEAYPRIDWVASKLGMTTRSLQRQLQTRGTSFNTVVDDVLNCRAKELLKHDRLSVTDIALSLGYTDPAHFTRAFRRRTGMAPSAYRNAGK